MAKPRRNQKHNWPNHMQTKINVLQASHLPSHGPLGMVGGPAHGPGVDIVQSAATSRLSDLITPSVLKELALAVPHGSGNCPVIPGRGERQPSQNEGDRHDVDHRIRLGLIQQLRPALACLAPPIRNPPASITCSLKTVRMYKKA
jgi:hypothetical protein